jgi:ribonucleoside-diphosphate reductase alpha chain
MLEFVTKRNGDMEPADAEKLLRWSSWSARGYEDRVNWDAIVRRCMVTRSKVLTTRALQNRLIKLCVRKKSWPYQIMAGRLFMADLRKDLYDNKIPTVYEQYMRMRGMELCAEMPYNEGEFIELERTIDHERDFELAYYQAKQLSTKYSLNLDTTGQTFETPQFVFMRMAMALAMAEERTKWLSSAIEFYETFSGGRVSNPTPNYLNLGTDHRGNASCCLIAGGDTAESIGVANHVAYTLTWMSAGIGTILETRSIKDGVRGGKIKHKGKLPYLSHTGKAVKANTQGGRGGALTSYVTMFDPEIETLLLLQNPRTTPDVRNRDLHLAFKWNAFVAEAAMNDDQIFLFNIKTAPDLHEAIDTANLADFTALYKKYEADPNFVKKYVSARDIVYLYMQQRQEVSTVYDLQIDYVNQHTPHKDRIRSSNLCVEILQPSAPYEDMYDLYQVDHHRGEVSMCSLAGIPIVNIAEDDDVAYERACYVALKTIDNAIMRANYKFPHIDYTVKQRMNAGVGILGLATWLARKGLKYDTPEGLTEIHRVYERHMYFMIRASLQLGKELGNAPWMDKTKWPEGWMPIDTYNRNLDEVVAPNYRYDWEGLRAAVIANKGIRNSSLVAHMPTESSSKAVAAPNCAYPVRDLTLLKTDLTNAIDWCAPDNDILEDQYQLAWEISAIDMMKVYGVICKFSDQGISADGYQNRKLKPKLGKKELLLEFIAKYKYGVKGGYYQNSFTESPTHFLGMEDEEDFVIQAAGEAEEANDRVVCEGGTCTL